MKKYVIILLIFILKTLSIEAQDINQLMQDYDNLYALEHIELFTKSENVINYKEKYGALIPPPPKSHGSLKIINVDADWLENISNLVLEDPSILYPYLDLETQNLAAYILLLHILEIDLPKPGRGFKETVYLNRLNEGIFNPVTLTKFKIYKNTPTGEDPAKYVLNTIWKDIANEGANARLKNAIENKP